MTSTAKSGLALAFLSASLASSARTNPPANRQRTSTHAFNLAAAATRRMGFQSFGNACVRVLLSIIPAVYHRGCGPSTAQAAAEQVVKRQQPRRLPSGFDFFLEPTVGGPES